MKFNKSSSIFVVSPFVSEEAKFAKEESMLTGILAICFVLGFSLAQFT